MKKVAIFSALIMAPIIVAVAIWVSLLLLKANKTTTFLSDFKKVNETKPALTVAQVEQLMGQPLRIEHAESTGVTGDVYHYPTYPLGGDFQVVFVNGVVFLTALPTYTPQT